MPSLASFSVCENTLLLVRPECVHLFISVCTHTFLFYGYYHYFDAQTVPDFGPWTKIQAGSVSYRPVPLLPYALHHKGHPQSRVTVLELSGLGFNSGLLLASGQLG